MALASFSKLEQKFTRKPSLRQAYSDFMIEYAELGHMTPIGPLNDHFANQNFLPHFAVIREESETTKTRVVFDGSAKTANKVSLNDCLHSGPALQVDILALITRWRRFEFVLKSDVTKMFRQIVLHPDDRWLQCVLWRPTPESQIFIYELNTVTYGLRCSPFLANRTILQMCSDEQEKFPSAAAEIPENVYVDDALLRRGEPAGSSPITGSNDCVV